jgi:hypothetical protein
MSITRFVYPSVTQKEKNPAHPLPNRHHAQHYAEHSGEQEQQGNRQGRVVRGLHLIIWR